MNKAALRPNSLVLYKGRPARVSKVGRKKVVIELEAEPPTSVRPKDVSLLHPGPVSSLSELGPQTGEVRTAWELLAGAETTLAELAELAYGEYTPATAWAAWQLVAEGHFFSGTPFAVLAHSAKQVTAHRAQQEARAAEERAWSVFLERAGAGRYTEADSVYLEEVVAVALGDRERSRVLRALGKMESRENAHALLLELGFWDVTNNPYPHRAGLTLAAPEVCLPEFPEEPRKDLTGLVALAIDDEGSHDPDDALSYEDGRLWVHIADVAALLPPDCPADVEARGRGATLYLPEGPVPMLPEQVARGLALGLQDTSPALSFGLDIGPEGQIEGLEIVRSCIRVTRLTYDGAEGQLDTVPLRNMVQVTRAFEEQRRRNGSIQIELPEVRLRVRGGQAAILPVPRLRSRDLVREAMLMVGEAVGGLALERGISVPFTVQEEPAMEPPNDTSPSAMVALRRSLRPSQQTSVPMQHAGLGLTHYVQCTSPLRRYLDLFVHQQLRAYVRGDSPLDARAVMERVGAAESLTGSVRWAERRSIEHWTLVYLLQHPDWSGRGFVVDRKGRHDTVLIPDLGMEYKVYSRQSRPMDSPVTLALRSVNLPELEAHFQYIG